MTVFNGNKTQWLNTATTVVPHTVWRFALRFFSDSSNDNDALELLTEEAISITMPSIKDTVSTRNFMNTRRSYNTGRNTTGTVSVKFNTRPMFNPLFDALNMQSMNYTTGGLITRAYLDEFRQFTKVEITMLPYDASMAQQKQLTLHNVHLVDINADGLNYEGNSKVTVSLTLHYDLAYWSNTDHLFAH